MEDRTQGEKRMCLLHPAGVFGVFFVVGLVSVSCIVLRPCELTGFFEAPSIARVWCFSCVVVRWYSIPCEVFYIQ